MVPSGAGVDLLGHGQGQIGHVVNYAYGEAGLGVVLLQLVINGLDHGGGEFLGAQTVTAADDLNIEPAGLGKGIDHVLIERLALGAAFLGAVEHGDLLAGGGRAASSLSARKGLYRRTFIRPSFSPRALR